MRWKVEEQEGLRAIGITCLGTSGAGRGEKSHSSTNGNVWAIRAPVDKPLASKAKGLVEMTARQPAQRKGTRSEKVARHGQREGQPHHHR